MQGFVKSYVKKVQPDANLPDIFIQDYLPGDEDVSDPALKDKENIIPNIGTNNSVFNTTQITVQAEDFGGSLAFPIYNFRRPSTDYYNSNLIMHNFVVSDATKGISTIYYFDERGQDKGADALCSLRMKYHLDKIQEDSPPSISVSILDNCVGGRTNPRS